jgi:hypothetical protein
MQCLEVKLLTPLDCVKSFRSVTTSQTQEEWIIAERELEIENEWVWKSPEIILKDVFDNRAAV